MYELRDHLITALDAGCITREAYKQHNVQAIEVARPINGYIRATTQRKFKDKMRT